MILVDFIHRSSKPINPNKGTFYWVEYDDKTEIWFASSNDVDGLILLNNQLDIERIQETLRGVKEEIIREIDLSPYLTSGDLEGYAKIDDIPDVSNFVTRDELDDIELTDSDYNMIIEKVSEKLTWKVI